MSDVTQEGASVGIHLPEVETRVLHERYAARDVRVILEYGSGGSTVMASRLPGKTIYSVESDREWAMSLQLEIDAADLPSPALVYHVDIGPVGEWGRPTDSRAHKRFHRYPSQIWDEPFFRHPDLVLVDGRFRPACLATVCLRARRPVTVLFDDYEARPDYRVVEALVRPKRMIGRMAEFHVAPGAVTPERTGAMLAAFAQGTYAGGDRSYGAPEASISPARRDG